MILSCDFDWFADAACLLILLIYLITRNLTEVQSKFHKTISNWVYWNMHLKNVSEKKKKRSWKRKGNIKRKRKESCRSLKSKEHMLLCCVRGTYVTENRQLLAFKANRDPTFPATQEWGGGKKNSKWVVFGLTIEVLTLVQIYCLYVVWKFCPSVRRNTIVHLKPLRKLELNWK